MASTSSKAIGSTKGKEIPLAATIEDLPLKNNQINASEPDLDAEKAKIWQSHVLIPYSVSDTVYAFLGPYPDPELKTPELEESFHGYNGRRPIVFSKDIPNMSYMTHRVFRSSPSSLHAPAFLSWLKKVESNKASVWKTLGIYNLIQISRT